MQKIVSSALTFNNSVSHESLNWEFRLVTLMNCNLDEFGNMCTQDSLPPPDFWVELFPFLVVPFIRKHTEFACNSCRVALCYFMGIHPNASMTSLFILADIIQIRGEKSHDIIQGKSLVLSNTPSAPCAFYNFLLWPQRARGLLAIFFYSLGKIF